MEWYAIALYSGFVSLGGIYMYVMVKEADKFLEQAELNQKIRNKNFSLETIVKRIKINLYNNKLSYISNDKDGRIALH